jgi:hypothetical protein
MEDLSSEFISHVRHRWQIEQLSVGLKCQQAAIDALSLASVSERIL